MWTKILTLGSFAATILISATITSTPAKAACVVGVASDDVLNMRSRATSGSSIVRGIPPGVCGIKLTGRYKGNWTRVRYRGATGWVNLRYIDEGGDGDGGAIPVYCVQAPGDHLNFRSGPGTGYGIVGSANHGWCGMTKLRCRGKWCRMRTHEFDGWVNSNYVRRR